MAFLSVSERIFKEGHSEKFRFHDAQPSQGRRLV